MSTYWYFECMDHTPTLTSDEFTQHTDDRHYERAVEMVANRPVSLSDTTEDYYQTDAERADQHFTRNTFAFLSAHPNCQIGFVNEYDERRTATKSEGNLMSDNENVPIDVTAMQAEAVVQAAMKLVVHKKNTQDNLMNREEWKLVEAVEAYGFKFKGVRGL